MANSVVKECVETIMSGGRVSFEQAENLMDSDVLQLAEGANSITRKFNGDRIDVEVLINAKSGRCPEDCSFCAQSSFYDTGITKYPLLPTQAVLEQAEKAKMSGAASFCIVCAYKSPPEQDFIQICETIRQVKERVGIDVNASLGFMTPERARTLKTLGVKRYNHNLETAESYFSQICKTHDFADRVQTARIVKEAGLELCSGGIIGMGESKRQRIELAFSLASLEPEEVPINILIGRKGTPLESMGTIDPLDAIRTIAVWRFIMPKTILKIAGGREVHLKEKDRMALKAGANGIITGGYLTTGGNSSSRDIAMIQEIGLKTQ
jgi:biotin synthase